MSSNETKAYEEMGQKWLRGEIIIKQFGSFRLNPKQVEYVNSKDPELLMCGGYRSGKTVAMIIKMWLLSMWFPNNRLLLGRKTLSDIETATMPAIQDVFLPGSYRYSPGKRMIEFPNGSQILLYGLDTSVAGDDTKKAAQKIKGLDLGGAFIDQLEEVSFLMYEQLGGRMSKNVPFRQICATTNPANFWAYDYFKIQPTKDPNLGRKLIETGMEDNREHLPVGFIESQMTKGDRYVRRFVIGEWSPDTLTDGAVFEPEFIDRMRGQIKEPIQEHGGIKIYELPAKEEYQIGVDPSLGSSDPCSIKVISKSSGREVASFNGYVPTIQIVNKTLILADMYSKLKEPVVVPEVTGVGQAYIEELRKRYDKIYIREVYNTRAKKKTNKLGFHTNYASKTQLIEHFRKLLENDFPMIRDRTTFEEFQIFSYSDTATHQGASAPEGYHDDNVMATLLAYWNVEGEGNRSKEDVKQDMITAEFKKINKEWGRIKRKRNHAR